MFDLEIDFGFAPSAALYSAAFALMTAWGYRTFCNPKHVYVAPFRPIADHRRAKREEEAE